MTIFNKGWVWGGAIGCLLAWTTLLPAGWVWTPETGWFNPDRAVTATPQELLASSKQAFEAKRYRDAALGYRLLLNTYPRSPESSQAYTLLLDAQYLGRDFEGALDTIELILDRNPDADTVSKVVWRKYEIGSSFLTGTPRYFLGIRYSGGSFGAEILQSIVERFPFLSFSDDALYHVAGHYFRRTHYDEAELIYEKLIQQYPESEWVALSEYQIGESALKRLKGIEYDFGPLDKAELHFRRYLRNHPGGDKVQDARRGLQEIDRLRSERLYLIARFYLRERQPKPARFYLQKILRDHPEAEASQQARDLLRSMGDSK